MFCFNAIYSQTKLDLSLFEVPKKYVNVFWGQTQLHTIKKLELGKYIKAVNSVPCYSPDFDDKDIMKMKTCGEQQQIDSVKGQENIQTIIKHSI